MAPSRTLFALLCASLLVESMLYGIIAPLVPYYARELAIGPGELGLIFAVYSLALLGGSFPAGIFCDRFGRRRVLLFGLAMLILSTLFFALVDNVWLMLLSRFLQGAAGAAIWTSVLAAAAALYPPGERGGRMGLMMAITGLGIIIGPVVSGFAAERWGYQAPFWGVALVIFVVTAGILMLKLPEPSGCVNGRGINPASFFQGLGNAETVVVMLLVAAGSFSFGLLEPLLPLHLSREFGLGGQGIGIVFGVLGISYTIFEPLMGFLSDRLGYRPVIWGGLAGTSIIMPVLTLVDSLYLLYVLICIYSLVSCAMMVPCLPLLAEQSDASGGENYGRQFGLANAAYSAGLLLGPAIGGLVAHYVSFLGATVVYSALLVVPGVMVLRRYGTARVKGHI